MAKRNFRGKGVVGMIKPIYKELERKLEERIKYLNSKIDDFDTPLTEEDYVEKFKSRLTGDKSAKSLRGYYDELIVREEELGLLRSFVYYYQRKRI